MRVSAEHVWPELRNAFCTPSLTAFGEALGVEVVEQHVGRLAAELEGDLLDGLGAELGDALAGAGRAGERHHVDVGVGGDRLADRRAVAGDEVEHAGRQADLVDDLGEHEGVERGDLARLDHDGAAGGHGVGDLGGDLVQRVVPRRDAADDADRLAHDERVPDRLLEASSASAVAAAVLKLLIGRPTWTICDSHLAMPVSLEIVVASSSMRAPRASPMRDRYLARSSTGVCDQVSNAALAACDGAVDVGGRPGGDGGHHVLGDGVDDVDGLGGVRRGERPVDVQLVERGHGGKLATP